MSISKKITKEIEFEICFEEFLEVKEKIFFFSTTKKKKILVADLEKYIVDFFSNFTPKPISYYIDYEHKVKLTFKINCQNKFEMLERGVEIRDKIKNNWDNKKVKIHFFSEIYEKN